VFDFHVLVVSDIYRYEFHLPKAWVGLDIGRIRSKVRTKVLVVNEYGSIRLFTHALHPRIGILNCHDRQYISDAGIGFWSEVNASIFCWIMLTPLGVEIHTRIAMIVSCCLTNDKRAVDRQ
jgi:hypothetical protein